MREQQQVVRQAEVQQAIEVANAMHEQTSAAGQRLAQVTQAFQHFAMADISGGMEGHQRAHSARVSPVQQASERLQREEREVELNQQGVDAGTLDRNLEALQIIAITGRPAARDMRLVS